MNLDDVDGLRITRDKQPILGGKILGLAHDLDRLFVHWAGKFGAEEQRYPALVSVEDLNKLEYFKSFPHQAIFPVTLSPEDENLNKFADDPVTPEGVLKLAKTAPIHHCMAPAACFPVYISMAGINLPGTKIVTLTSPCFRKEREVVPLARQTSFTMREVVCVGQKENVQSYLAEFRQVLERFFERWSFPVALEHATDPFFNAPTNRKYIMQKVAPLKHEMVYSSELAIGSINFHQNSFGETFDIKCEEVPVFSGCVAFGLERWLFAFLDHFGTDSKSWPGLAELTAD